MQFFSKNRKKVSGTSMIELIVYIAIFVVIAVVVVQGIVQLMRIYGRSRYDRRVNLAAQTALERLVREVRLAKNVEVDGSTLTLSVYPDFEPDPVSDIPIDKTIQLSGGQILISGTPITGPDVSVAAVTYTKVDTTRPSGQASYSGSSALRIAITIEAGGQNYSVSRKFTALAVLRNSY